MRVRERVRVSCAASVTSARRGGIRPRIRASSAGVRSRGGRPGQG